MLILVGVTINVALNGGLFSTTEKAVSNTQLEAEREQLLSSVTAAYETETGTINKSKLEVDLGTDWRVDGEEGGPYTVTSPKGNKFTVAANGTIGNYQGITLSSTKITINKIGGTAEITATLEGLEGEITWESSSDEIATVAGNGNKATITAVKNGTVTITARCGDTTATVTITVSVKDVILPEGLTVGSEFEMDANKDGTKETWIVLYDGTADHLNENEIEVISKDTMGNLTLGANDTEATNATDIDGNGTLEDIEKAIYSYNNAIDRINKYCASLIKIDNLGVRSVGSKPSNPSYRTESTYAIKSLDSWSDKTAWETYGILGEDSDTNYTEDYKQMNTIGIQVSSDAKGYWTASRVVNEFSSDSVIFSVLYVDKKGITGGDSLWYVDSSSSAYGFNHSYAVRPIIRIQYP